MERRSGKKESKKQLAYQALEDATSRKEMKSYYKYPSLSSVIGDSGWSGGGGGSGSVPLKTDQNNEKKKKLLDVEEAGTTEDFLEIRGIDLEGWSRRKGGSGSVPLNTDQNDEKKKLDLEGDFLEITGIEDVWSGSESEASPSSDIDQQRMDKLPMTIKPQVSLPPSTPPPLPPSPPPPPSEREEVQVPPLTPSDCTLVFEESNKINDIENIQPKDKDPFQLQESSGTPIEDTVVALSKSNKRAKKWEILQCIVRCSLFELVTSLLLLTSAATSNISNGNIVALALTNLITGLFIFRPYLMRVLKKHKVKMGQSGAQVEHLNSGNKVLRDITHYLLSLTLIIASFLIFGMVPPMVYAFTFHNSDDKNLKLAATLGASLLCTSFLIILAICLQKLKGWLVYVKYVLCCASVVVLLFGLSYLLGYLFGKLVEKLDWFE